MADENKQYEFDSGIKVDGNTALNGSVTITGDLNVTGSVTIPGTATANIVPSSNLAYSLGETGLVWDQLHIRNLLANTTHTVFRNVKPQFLTSNTSLASLNIPHGAAPTSPADGDVWTTSSGIFVRVNSATKTVAFTDSNISGRANSANVLTTARTITLGGVLTGNVSFDGSANVSITAAFANAYYNQTESDARYAQLAGAIFTGNVHPSANGGALGNTTKRWAASVSTLNASGDATLGANLAVTGNVAITGTLTVGSSPIDTTANNITTAANGIIFVAGGTNNFTVTVTRGASANAVISWNESLDRWQLGNGTSTSNVVVADSNTYAISISGNANTANTATSASSANNSSYLGGQLPAYYTDIVSRLGYTPLSANSNGTITGNLTITGTTLTVNGKTPVYNDSGTYSISISGNANTANTATSASSANNSAYLGGQLPAYYTDIPARLGYTPLSANSNGTITGNLTITGTTLTVNGKTPVYNDSGTYGISITGNANTANTATSASSANNSSYLGGQLPSYYTDIPARLGYTPLSANSNGTITGNLTITGTTLTVNGKTPVYNDSGTYNVSINGNANTATTATNATSANNSSYLGGQLPSYYTDIPARLGYTPLNANAGGTVSANLTVSGNLVVSGTTLTVGGKTPVYNDGGTYNITANNATNFNGQAASYYANATNLTTGTLPAARLSGSYDISVLTANNATNFNGQAASYYANASNLSTGTVPSGRLTGSYDISISGTANNATNFNGQAASYYANASNLSTGTVAAARLSGTYNITANNATNLNGQAASYYTDIPARLGYTPLPNSANTWIQDASAQDRIYFTTSGPLALKSPTTFLWKDTSNNTIMTLTQAGTLTAVDDVVAYSDAKIKTDFRDIPGLNDAMNTIRGHSYLKLTTNKRSLGVIAQDVERIYPELVQEVDGVKTVNYDGLVAVLWEIVRDMKYGK